ncbi:helix-turn-helix domain-containing protein [Streptomyces sp. NPDC046197]|uniref:helix-turn-helix domain-containing protein n=1 Tax=Streptomyces sp. NPDC046197 TaxID=3154337 RepID=UPI0033DBADC8
MTQPEDGRVTEGGHVTWPGPRRIRNQKEFRIALGQLRESRGITLKELEKASDDGSRKLASATVSNVLRMDALPNRDFVVRFLRACGLSDTEREPWLTCWEALDREGGAPSPAGTPQDPVGTSPDAVPAGAAEAGTPENAVPVGNGPTAPPGGHGTRWALLLGGRRRLRAGVVVACTVVALAVGVGAWQWQRLDDRQAHEKQVQDLERFKKKHCGTLNPSLVTGAGGECTGVTDGSDGSAVFGSDLKPVMTAIGAENRNVAKSGDYVTIAFLTPLTSKDANNLTVGQYVAELEGAYTAIEEENSKNSRPRIRLVVANMGSSEKQWAQAVDQLAARRDADRLVAVTGMGLSQQETVDASRALSKADLPMIGDLITADGFDATGAVDGKGPINGLARVALTNTDQLTAISKELGPTRRTAALVSTSVTPNGTRDLYTESLNRGFRTVEGLKKHLDDTSDFTFDPRGGPGAILPTISQNLCNTGKTIDTVYYAARVKYLPDFLDALARRSCHSQPITVITGSDAAALDPKTVSLHDGDAPITVLYASFPSAAQFRGSDNPDRGLYDTFAKAFTSPHHGQQFPGEHLTSSYWAIVAHDAVLTAATALHNAAANGDGPPSLPNRYAVRNELYALRNGAVPGASGRFGIDNKGNRTNTTTITTVHRLGQPLPASTQHPS